MNGVATSSGCHMFGNYWVPLALSAAPEELLGFQVRRGDPLCSVFLTENRQDCPQTFLLSQLREVKNGYVINSFLSLPEAAMFTISLPVLQCLMALESCVFPASQERVKTSGSFPPPHSYSADLGGSTESTC